MLPGLNSMASSVELQAETKNVAQSIQQIAFSGDRVPAAVFICAARGVHQAQQLSAAQRKAIESMHEPLADTPELPDVTFKTSKNIADCVHFSMVRRPESGATVCLQVQIESNDRCSFSSRRHARTESTRCVIWSVHACDVCSTHASSHALYSSFHPLCCQQCHNRTTHSSCGALELDAVARHITHAAG